MNTGSNINLIFLSLQVHPKNIYPSNIIKHAPDMSHKIFNNTNICKLFSINSCEMNIIWSDNMTWDSVEYIGFDGLLLYRIAAMEKLAKAGDDTYAICSPTNHQGGDYSIKWAVVASSKWKLEYWAFPQNT